MPFLKIVVLHALFLLHISVYTKVGPDVGQQGPLYRSSRRLGPFLARRTLGITAIARISAQEAISEPSLCGLNMNTRKTTAL